MKLREIKDNLLENRTFKGIVYGVLGTLAVEFIILLTIFAFRSMPDASEREIRRMERKELRQERREFKAMEMSRERTAESGSRESSDTSVPDGKTGEINAGSQDADVYEYNIPISEYRKEEGSIRRGEFFSTLMTRLGASQSDIYALDAKSKGVFDMRQIRVGNHYHAYYIPGEPDTLAYVVYEKDNLSYVVFSLRDSLSVNVFEKDIVRETGYVEVEIK